jgi:hypothetical protein
VEAVRANRFRSGLEKEIRHINEQQQRWGPRRYAEATQDIDDLIGCYRRIETLFRQMQVQSTLVIKLRQRLILLKNNAILSVWAIANEHLAVS